MSKHIKYAVIPADDRKPIRFEEAEPTLALWQGIVGGYIESVSIHQSNAVKVFPVPVGMKLFVDEEGKLKGSILNRRATLLAEAGLGIRPTDAIFGDVAVFGGVNGDGDCTGLQQLQTTVLEALTAYFGD